MKKSLSISDLMMIGGAAVVLLFSFFGFSGSGGFSVSAWNTDAGAFATAVPAILALALLVWSGLEIFGVSVPDQVLTFTPPQLKATWAIAAAGILLSWATVDNRAGMFWIQLLGGLVMAAGTIAALLGQLDDPVIKATAGGADAPLSAPTPSASGTQPPPPPPAPGNQPSPPPGSYQPPPPANG